MTSDRFGGPGWEIHSGPVRAPFASLTTRPAMRWYLGAAFSLLWLVTVAPDVVTQSSGVLATVAGILLVIVFALAFLASAPLAWTLPRHLRLAPAGILLALSFTLFPWIGWGVRGIWTYVGVAIGMAVMPILVTWAALLGLGALAVLAGVLTEGWDENVFWIPAIIVSISAMMAAFARNLAAMNELRATRDRMAQLAVERERSRVARDIHDILGHSLTVITVKAELAGRLVDADPARARTEIGDVEQLARGALADVRSTVAGYRGVSVAGELVAARAALEAAGITPDLPGSIDAVAPAQRELAGWVVREGVTNVVRHAAASVCRVRLDAAEIAIDDDGMGPVVAAADTSGGNGLAGLRERVEAAGGVLSVGRSDLGGFRLRVRL
ncbi:sensor histidine kinase [Microbacterium sp.]|uniref:sensor histidine kinase n=1 Tax=Microbacterium sp. TaxID=51671 RepID=UPI0025DD66C8|nr:sensor histidine kinase [Microbacterium sp.]